MTVIVAQSLALSNQSCEESFAIGPVAHHSGLRWYFYWWPNRPRTFLPAFQGGLLWRLSDNRLPSFLDGQLHMLSHTALKSHNSEEPSWQRHWSKRSFFRLLDLLHSFPSRQFFCGNLPPRRHTDGLSILLWLWRSAASILHAQFSRTWPTRDSFGHVINSLFVTIIFFMK